MLRRALLIALIAVFAVPVAAQVPAGWKVRTDGSPSAPLPTPIRRSRSRRRKRASTLTGGPGSHLGSAQHASSRSTACERRSRS